MDNYAFLDWKTTRQGSGNRSIGEREWMVSFMSLLVIIIIFKQSSLPWCVQICTGICQCLLIPAVSPRPSCCQWTFPLGWHWRSILCIWNNCVHKEIIRNTLYGKIYCNIYLQLYDLIHLWHCENVHFLHGILLW